MKQLRWNITNLTLSNAWISHQACVDHITLLHQSLLCCIHERTVHNQDLRELWLHVSCCNQKRTTSYEKLPETTEKYICLFNKMAHKKIKCALFLLALWKSQLMYSQFFFRFFFLFMGRKTMGRFWITFTANTNIRCNFTIFPHIRKWKFTNRPLHERHGFFNFWLGPVKENPSTQLEKIP